MSNEKSLETRIDVMGAKMTMRSPFISAVFTTLKKNVVDDDNVTASTNGLDFRFGRKFCEGLDEEELLGLGLHEAAHVVLGHIWRGEGYDAALSNVAQDAVINRMLLGMGYKLPKNGVFIDWVTGAMDWEEVYRRLKREQDEKQKDGPGGQHGGNQGGQGGQQGKQGKQPGQGSNNSHGNNSGGQGHEKWGAGGFNGQGDCTPCPTEAKRNEIEATILTAAKMARACGDTSAMIDRVLGKVGKSSVSWADECRAMLLSQSKGDYSFSKGNRRMLGQGLYLPSLRSESMGGLAVAFDMSGSVSPKDAQRIATELQGVVDDCQPDWVEIAFFDTKVCSVQRFERGETLELKPRGGGGTRFAPVFEHFASVQENEQICGMIFFTDMCSSDLMGLQEPTYPVLWANICGNDGVVVPFGRVVRVAV
jgi:predicted metal-dependent peptidase